MGKRLPGDIQRHGGSHKGSAVLLAARSAVPTSKQKGAATCPLPNNPQPGW